MNLKPTTMLEQAKKVLAANGHSLYAPYQLDGVRKLLINETLYKHHRGGLLCDEMGLGKTIQMISLILGNLVDQTLIVMPMSLIQQWINEIKKFTGDTFEIVVFHGTDRNLIDLSIKEKPQIVLTSYGLMSRNYNSKLHQIKWDRIISEECHLIRNHKSRTSRSMCLLRSKYKWGITGTPVHNSLKDLTSICKFLGFDPLYVRAYTKDIVRKYVLRRTKLDVSRFNQKLNLPDKVVELFNIKYKTEQEKQFYHSIKKKIDKKIQRLTQLNINNTIFYLEMLLRMRQAAILPQLVIEGLNKKFKTNDSNWLGSNTKLDFISSKVLKLKDVERPIIFTQFNSEMLYLYNKLKAKMRIELINGSISMIDRANIIQRAHTITDKDDKNYIDCLIIQIDAGGTGLNLQMFDSVWFSTITWNPAIEMQAIARVHRIGQQKRVKIRKVIMEDTIESRIIEVQNKKIQIMIDVLEDPNIRSKTINKLSLNTIKKLLN